VFSTIVKKNNGVLLFRDVGNKKGPVPPNVFTIDPRMTGCDTLVARMICESPWNASVIVALPLPNVIVLPDVVQVPMI
jgi:hypothetical protein